ncbi:Flp family type IVb pilin [Algihabitans albus]|uniref:Flp family type IVb pilin n=1 Tax=Algihabitans albus TaxID=2164067 RepID=UPI000E5D70C3|nr:Flp family type IVb pilin [Algihabitans albus]
MRRLVTLLMKSKTGATAIEYGLIAALVAVAAIAGMTQLGGALDTIFSGVGGTLEANTPAALGGGEGEGEGEGEGG